MCESMLAMSLRLEQLYSEGKSTIGMIGRIKSHNTSQAREVCAMAREMCGGNGILMDFHIIKQFMDIEAIHSRSNLPARVELFDTGLDLVAGPCRPSFEIVGHAQ